MNGPQRSHKQLNGKRFLKLVVFTFTACTVCWLCVLLVASVLPKPGLSDWELSICDEYYLVRANKNSKKICKATDTDGLFEDVLSNYYVTRYFVLDSFIYLEGLSTEEIIVSKEELACDNRQYYMLDVRDGNLCGPYDTEDELLIPNTANEIGTMWIIVPP